MRVKNEAGRRKTKNGNDLSQCVHLAMCVGVECYVSFRGRQRTGQRRCGIWPGGRREEAKEEMDKRNEMESRKEEKDRESRATKGRDAADKDWRWERRNEGGDENTRAAVVPGWTEHKHSAISAGRAK